MRILVKETNGTAASVFKLPLLSVDAVIPAFVTTDDGINLQLDVFGVVDPLNQDIRWQLMDTQAFTSFVESGDFEYAPMFQFFAKGQVFQLASTAWTVDDQNYYLVRVT